MGGGHIPTPVLAGRLHIPDWVPHSSATGEVMVLRMLLLPHHIAKQYL